MKAIVSEKGQVTIPKKLRDRLGITPGAVLEFREDAGVLLATKASGEDAIAAVFGIIDTDRPVDDLVEEMRGRPPER
ncbi:MAG TPA: AbrB/MazE/SpoVT family DNA-binding domain-containing protein [Gaiella sp.]|jgi:AbrB family looped-hinge helix DNA binding protein|nr:AbrB/MazE/SpoVT family DNA-binding domain-containing protein [Gaiella sp.]